MLGSNPMRRRFKSVATCQILRGSMDVLHKFILGGEIFFAAVLGLIVASAIFGEINKLRNLYTPWSKAEIPTFVLQSETEGWPHRALVAFDIWFNVTILKGQQDETISTHAWRAQLDGKTWGKLMNKWLDGFQPSHGYKAAVGDLTRAKSRVQVLSNLLGI
jgi:hypothetical protein